VLNLIFKIVKTIGGPGSIGLFILLFLGGIVLLRKRRRIGLSALALLLILYGFLSVPAVSTALEESLRSPAVPHDPVKPGQRITLVVLGGDNDLGRDRETARLLAQLRPERVVVLGDAGIGRTVREAGFRAPEIIEDDGPGTTRDQIAAIAKLPRRPDDCIVLVASRLQMPRVIGLLRSHNLDVVPVASDVNHPVLRTGWRKWWPSFSALEVSRDALYEQAALAYYRWRGWIR
jgi:uncharacterized SAM-binding protein YcdF (DUF218 family)